ncbi:MAG: hypothetical protein NTX30_08770, partial [Deltaproteobacteria bacterium]|nr:hypothetical protein [Deltaproteobacteria bacterium]
LETSKSRFLLFLRFLIFFLGLFFFSVLAEGGKMGLHVIEDPFNLIPGRIDRFAHLLWGACFVHLNGTGPLQFIQVFVYSLKETDDRFFLLEHAIKAGL